MPEIENEWRVSWWCPDCEVRYPEAPVTGPVTCPNGHTHDPKAEVVDGPNLQTVRMVATSSLFQAVKAILAEPR
jgi:hypothetical protein